MGPKNAFEPWFKEAIKTKVPELKFSGNVDEFLSELKALQDNLAGLARVYQTLEPSLMTTRAKLAGRYIEAISQNEKKLMSFVGTPKKLKRALDMIESMSFHQIFTKELESESLFIKGFQI
jgi:hypothetical protein